MSVLARSCLALWCCVAAVPAHAGDTEARVWLERMSQALATRNYDGRFFHLNESQSETMRIVHRVAGGKSTERLVSLDGSGREIIRTDAEVICYLPDKRTVLVEGRTDRNPLLAALPTYADGLEQHYRITVEKTAKVLGRKTQLISVQPRDEFRYGYRLWLDYESAMPLKSQLCDSSGRIIEQIAFAQLDLPESIDSSALQPAVKTDGYTWVRHEIRRRTISADSIGWSVQQAPAGFRLTTTRVQPLAGSRTPVRHLVYSDGLASVSIFIEPRAKGGEALRGASKMGAASTYSADVPGYQITAVGEVPQATVEAMATSVTRDNAK